MEIPAQVAPSTGNSYGFRTGATDQLNYCLNTDSDLGAIGGASRSQHGELILRQAHAGRAGAAGRLLVRLRLRLRPVPSPAMRIPAALHSTGNNTLAAALACPPPPLIPYAVAPVAMSRAATSARPLEVE